jgi:hypothetical protein
MLMPLWILSQNITLTPAQETRVKQIFTPEKIIDISKAIDNEQRQYLEILSLQGKIDSLKILAQKKDVIIAGFVNEISTLNKSIQALSAEEDTVSDNQLKDARKPFLGLHLSGRAQTQEIQLDRLMFSIDLSYTFEKINFGASVWTQYELDKSTFYYGPFIEYKFF